MVRWLLAGVFLSACGFQAEPVDGDDPDSGDVADPGGAPPGNTGGSGTGSGSSTKAGTVIDIAVGDDAIGTGDLTIHIPGGPPQNRIINIDTSGTNPQFGGPLPTGVTYKIAKIGGTGAEIVVLHARKLVIEAELHVTGTRPLVLIADDFQLPGTIGVTAHTPSQAASELNSQGGAVEIYGKQQIAISGVLQAGIANNAPIVINIGGGGGGGGNGPGTIVLQSKAVNVSGRLYAADSGGEGGVINVGDEGDGTPGKIHIYYQATHSVTGVATPTPTVDPYPAS